MNEVLYHYTSTFHLPLILKDGYLNLTESNLLKPKNNKDALPKKFDELYKPVVWLTKNPRPEHHGISSNVVNKHEIRFTFRMRDNYENWFLWSRNNRINKSWAKKLEYGCNPNDWYISETIIPINAEEIIRIENLISGEVLIDISSGIKTYSCVVKKAFDNMSPKVIDEYIGSRGLNVGDIVEITL